MYISLSVSCESLKLMDWQKHALIGMLLRGYSTCENSNCRVIDLPIVFTSEFYLCSPVFFSSLLSSHHLLLKYLVALLHTSTIILICIYSFRQPQRKQDPFLRTLFLMEQYQRFHTSYNQWPHGMILFEQSYHLLFMTHDQLNKIGLKTRTGPWKLVLCGTDNKNFVKGLWSQKKYQLIDVSTLDLIPLWLRCKEWACN